MTAAPPSVSALIAVSAVAACAAAAIRAPTPGLARLGVGRPHPRWSPTRRAGVFRVQLVMSTTVVALLAFFLAVVGSGAALLWGTAALTLGGGGLRAALHRSRRREQRQGTDVVIEVVTALSAELRAGHVPAAALFAAVSSIGPAASRVGHALAAVTPGSSADDVLAVLGSAQQLPGGNGLGRLRLCWEVSDASGAALANGVDRVAMSLRAQKSVQAEVASEMAAAQATGRMLALLPIATLGGGVALGVHPFAVLLGPWWGRGCLVLGVGLAGFGQWWVNAIARGALGAGRRRTP